MAIDARLLLVVVHVCIFALVFSVFHCLQLAHACHTMHSPSAIESALTSFVGNHTPGLNVYLPSAYPTSQSHTYTSAYVVDHAEMPRGKL